MLHAKPSPPALGRVSVLAAFAFAATALSGCAFGHTPHFASFEEALDASGPVYSPKGAASDYRLKLVHPSKPDEQGTGRQEIVVVLYDQVKNMPITDASFRMDAMMPAMGHGASPEKDPVHDAHGVYEGYTTFSMTGDWVLKIEPQLADGTTLYFDVSVKVGNGEGSMSH